MEALLGKRHFAGLDQCTWLYSGAETPPLKASIEALNQYMINRTKGPLGREENSKVELSCKRNFAKLLNGSVENIALLPNSSEIISMLAESFPFVPGDNVVIHTLEFPSGVLPWLLLKEQGVEVRIVEHQEWQVSVEDIMAQVDNRTRLVITSHVSYLSGARIDYQALYRNLANTDTLLLLDVTQSLGAVTVDMNAADFIVCSSYKWLLGIHGLGILAVNPKRTSHYLPRTIGWRSVSDMFGPNRFEEYTFYDDAKRFEAGYPSYASIYAMNASTELLLSVGVERIEQHILSLGDELIQKVTHKGHIVMTPTDPTKRAGNISIVLEEGERVADELRANHIYAWGGDRRLRASVHLFNDSADIDRFVELLPVYKAGG